MPFITLAMFGIHSSATGNNYKHSSEILSAIMDLPELTHPPSGLLQYIENRTNSFGTKALILVY